MPFSFWEGEHNADGAQGTARERLPYVSFEDERLAGLTATDLHPMIEEYYRRYPDARGLETFHQGFLTRTSAAPRPGSGT